jgi:hypothetical protein
VTSASRGAARAARQAGSLWVPCVAAVALTFASGRAHAARDLLSGISGLRLGVGASDNIDQTASNQPLSGEWLEAGLAGNFLETRPNFEGQLTSDVSYREYNTKAAGNEFVGGANGHASFNLFDNVLKWVADDVYGQSSINAYGPNSPQNREGTNYFSTGPDVVVPIAERTALTLNGRYSLATFDGPDSDSSRLSGGIGVERRISPLTTLRMEVTDSHLTFRDDVSPPFNIREATVAAHREGSQTTIDLQLGYSQLIEQGGSPQGAFLVRAMFSRNLTQRSLISVTAGEEYSDSAEFFQFGQVTTGAAVGYGNGIIAADPLRARYVFLDWSTNASRLTLNAETSYRQERHQTETALDVDRVAMAFGLSYRFSPRALIGVYDSLRNDQFTEVAETARENAIGVRYQWQFGRRLALGITYERDQGSGNTPGINYNANTASITFYYTGIGGATPPTRSVGGVTGGLGR